MDTILMITELSYIVLNSVIAIINEKNRNLIRIMEQDLKREISLRRKTFLIFS